MTQEQQVTALENKMADLKRQLDDHSVSALRR